MTLHFNGLTPAQAERLAMLAEEAGEVIQAVGKILRHGLDNWSPTNPDPAPNRYHLRREITDFLAVVSLLEQEGDIELRRASDVAFARDRRLRYAHHQGDVDMAARVRDEFIARDAASREETAYRNDPSRRDEQTPEEQAYDAYCETFFIDEPHLDFEAWRAAGKPKGALA